MGMPPQLPPCTRRAIGGCLAPLPHPMHGGEGAWVVGCIVALRGVD